MGSASECRVSGGYRRHRARVCQKETAACMKRRCKQDAKASVVDILSVTFGLSNVLGATEVLPFTVGAENIFIK